MLPHVPFFALFGAETIINSLGSKHTSNNKCYTFTKWMRQITVFVLPYHTEHWFEVLTAVRISILFWVVTGSWNPPSALQMEAVRSFKTLIFIYESKRRHKPYEINREINSKKDDGIYELFWVSNQLIWFASRIKLCVSRIRTSHEIPILFSMLHIKSQLCFLTLENADLFSLKDCYKK